MKKIILITGATDGIGLETAKSLVQQSHHVILHGRNSEKLNLLQQTLKQTAQNKVETITADLSDITMVKAMVIEVAERFGKLDIIINNAGVFTTSTPKMQDNLDVRFVVNTLAPYILTKELLPLFDKTGRVVNLSSAAQTSVDLNALIGKTDLNDNAAYAQSKLALTMWSRHLGLAYKETGPMIVSVNPKSFLGSKMVKEAYGVAGGDIQLGADILVKAALSDEFAQAHGAYFDNDIEAFAMPHSDALDSAKVNDVIKTLDSLYSQ
ncbi:SDR family NAD(P)-dependent oxidoreductase [Vibrio sp.]|uniref:SDR family NAD(P)-dependent oxidoreductase n=1 Tax=Vibrio sp. TaxID=678 RepID=UPI003AA8DA33